MVIIIDMIDHRITIIIFPNDRKIIKWVFSFIVTFENTFTFFIFILF